MPFTWGRAIPLPSAPAVGSRAEHAPSSLLALAALICVPGPARAECEAASADVSWVRGPGAETCPTAAEIRSEVARRLGRSIGAPGEGKAIEVTVEKTGDGWAARIVAAGCGGERAVRELTSAAPTCEAIASAAVLVIALAVDPQAALAPPPAPAETDSPVPPAPTVAAVAPPAAPVRPRRPPPAEAPAPAPVAAAPDPGVETRLTLRGVGAAGLLPAFAPGIAWSGEWRFSRWLSASTGLLFLPEQPARDPTFAFGMTAGWAGACSDVFQLAGRLAAGPCVRFLAGTIHAVVRTHPSIVGSGPGQRAWAGASAGGRVLVRVAGPLLVEAGVEALAPFTRHAFELRDAPEPVFLQPPITALLYIGAGLAFP